VKVYIVEAYSSEPFSDTSWVDSVFSSLKSAQDRINETRNQWGRPVELFTGDGMGYYLSDYITTRDVKE
jgi:hypothetical protein